MFLFLQLLLASCSEGKNLLAVVEQGVMVVSTVEDRVHVPAGVPAGVNTWSIRPLATMGWWGSFAGEGGTSPFVSRPALYLV